MVNVFDRSGEIIADVDYNNNLDRWNGQNWQSGGTGKHRGLTRLEDGRFVLIHGSDWQGVESYAELISKEDALQEILKSRDLDLLDEFELRGLYEQKLVKEKKSWATRTIKLRTETYEKLTSMKTGNDSYSDVIDRLIEEKTSK